MHLRESASPEREASSTSYDHYPLLESTDGDDSAAGGSRPTKDTSRGESSRRSGNATAELMRRLGVSPERRIKVTPEDDARVLRRIDLVVLPLMLAVYFLQGDIPVFPVSIVTNADLST
jgi:hypothetical protein